MNCCTLETFFEDLLAVISAINKVQLSEEFSDQTLASVSLPTCGSASTKHCLEIYVSVFAFLPVGRSLMSLASLHSKES